MNTHIQETKMSICIDCKHRYPFVLPRSSTCKKHPIDPEKLAAFTGIDPVTGKLVWTTTYHSTAWAGDEVENSRKFELCSKINPKGQCQEFEPIPLKVPVKNLWKRFLEVFKSNES